MPFDRPSDDERPGPDGILPPDDRLWRHPSELGGSHAPTERSRPITWLAVTAIVVGVALGAVVLWSARPVTDERADGSDDVRAATAPTGVSMLSVRRSLATVEIGDGDTWQQVSGLWVDAAGTLAVPALLLDGGGAVYVIGEDGRRQLARIAGVDDATGIATLVVATTDGLPATLGSRPDVGQRVSVVAADVEDPVAAARVEVLSVGEAADVDGTVHHDTVHLDHGSTDPVGSALVDEGGTVVAMVIGTDGEGRTIATPADTVRSVATALRDDGEVRWARLGVRVADTASSSGAQVVGLDDGSPGTAAGIQVDDVVTAVDGVAVHDAGDLVAALRAHDPGDDVAVTVERDGDRFAVAVTLG
ncbi:MAG: serine protease [Actinobacteria bacterium]|nr:serine protease [Actinomycetota bacterium]